MRRAWPWILVVVGGTLGAACNAILGLEPPPSPDAGGTTGGTGGRGPAPVCAAIDAGLPPQATVEAGTYLPFGPVAASDAGGNWEFFDVSVFTGSSTPNFAGGTFDGRYVYFASRGAGMVRYDTQGSFFDAQGAWEKFDVSKMKPPNPGGFTGAVYVGRFVYFIPQQLLGTTAIATTVARYDTTGDFKNPASWASFDVTTMAGASADAGGGYVGGVTDGTRLYLVPNHDAPNGSSPDGRVVRYVLPTDAGPPLDEDASAPDGGADAGSADAGLGFADPTPWTAFDLAGLDPEALGFAGAVYDGTNIYFVPQNNGAFGGVVHGGGSGTVARLRAESGFSVPSSWTFYDVTNVEGNAFGFSGGAFDGRYVYFVPHSQPIALRYDTKGDVLDSASNWSWYDVSRVAAVDGASTSFTGGAFDGRFVYFIPSATGFGQILRYDTLSTFTADCAWSTADLGSVVPTKGKPGIYNGAVFDGQYLYLIPSDNSLVARFQARTPASMPALPQFHGSFW